MVQKDDIDYGTISLIAILLAHVSIEPQPKPFLIKNGVKIIL